MKGRSERNSQEKIKEGENGQNVERFRFTMSGLRISDAEIKEIGCCRTKLQRREAKDTSNPPSADGPGLEDQHMQMFHTCTTNSEGLHLGDASEGPTIRIKFMRLKASITSLQLGVTMATRRMWSAITANCVLSLFVEDRRWCLVFEALSYLSPAAGLPFGTAPTAAASLPAGLRGQTLAALLRDDQAGGVDAADLTRPEPPSAGRRALQGVEGEKGLNFTPMPFFFTIFFFPGFDQKYLWQKEFAGSGNAQKFVENNSKRREWKQMSDQL